MQFKPPASDDATWSPHTYEFLEPVRVRIRKPDGTIVLVGYGIGERVEVMEPTIQYLVARHELLKEIPLADGSFIIEFPKDMKVRYAY